MSKVMEERSWMNVYGSKVTSQSSEFKVKGHGSKVTRHKSYITGERSNVFTQR